MSQRPKGLFERIKDWSVILQGAVAALILLTAIVGALATIHVLDPGPTTTTTSPPSKSVTTSPSSLSPSPRLSTPPAAAAAWLDDLSPLDGRPDFSGVFVVNGRDIPHGVGFNPRPSVTSQVSYDLGGHYATFEVDLVIGDGLAKQAAHFDVLGDGNSLLSGGVDVAPSSGFVHKSISVVGVRRLALVVTVSGSNPQAMFGNPRIVP